MRAASDDDEITSDAGDADAQLTLGVRVRVHPGTDTESAGVIVEDFGDMSGLNVAISANQVVKLPRRWAVALDDGTLVFVDSDQITTD
jgi:hypothetical protein